MGEANNANSVNYSTNVGVGFNYEISPKLQFNMDGSSNTVNMDYNDEMEAMNRTTDFLMDLSDITHDLACSDMEADIAPPELDLLENLYMDSRIQAVAEVSIPFGISSPYLFGNTLTGGKSSSPSRTHRARLAAGTWTVSTSSLDNTNHLFPSI